jgi:hypothetical protein
LIHPDVDQRIVDAITKNYRFGPLIYLILVVLTFVHPYLGILCNLALAIFFALPLNPDLFGGD